MIRTRTLILLLLFAVPVSAAETYLNIEFANVDGVSLQLDLYVPSGVGPHPVIVSIATHAADAILHPP